MKDRTRPQSEPAPLPPELRSSLDDFASVPDRDKFGPGIALCGALADKGHYTEALAVLSRLQPLTQSDFERAQILQRRGWIHLRQSEYDKAYYFLGEAMVKLGNHPDSLELFHVYHDLAWMSYRQGYQEKARNYCEGAQLVVRSMPLKSGRRIEEARAELLHLMALIEAADGAFEAALAHLESERQLRLAHGDPVKLASLYNKMSSVLQAQGRMRPALGLQLQALDLACRCGDQFRQAVSAKNLGEIRFSLGDLEAALDQYRQAFGLSQAVGNQLGLIFSHAGTGRILQARGDFAGARDHFLQGLDITRRIKSREQEYSLLLDLAGLFLAMGDEGEAAAQLESAQTLANELDQPLSPRHAIVLARLYAVAGGDRRRARELMEELLSRPIVVNDEEPYSIPELEIQAGGLLARLLVDAGEHGRAAAVLQRAVATVDGFVRDLDERDRTAVLSHPCVREVFALNAAQPAAR